MAERKLRIPCPVCFDRPAAERQSDKKTFRCPRGHVLNSSGQVIKVGRRGSRFRR